MEAVSWSVLTLFVALPTQGFCAAGTEGAAFLEIPVGAGPASLGAAYSALAEDAYAPTWNPGGLGFVTDTEVAAQHIDYLQSINYEYLSLVRPLGRNRALGGSIQYLGSGDINGTDINGSPTGIYTSHYVAYNLSYGQKLWGQHAALGITGKMIHAAIADTSASAYAVDMGVMYQPQENLSLGLVLDNVGTKLTLGSQPDPLPLAMHAGIAYKPIAPLTIAMESVYSPYYPTSFHGGLEWSPLEAISLRGGYRTDTIAQLSPMAGLTAGAALRAWGQELDYAWIPFGDLGNTQYLSLVMHFGQPKSHRNLIQYHALKNNPASQEKSSNGDYQLLMELLSDHDTDVAQTNHLPNNQ